MNNILQFFGIIYICLIGLALFGLVGTVLGTWAARIIILIRRVFKTDSAKKQPRTERNPQ